MKKERFNEILSKVDESTVMQLDQLRRYLRMGKASVMVGAGFSKNAVIDEGVIMRNWSELCECFHKELYGRAPSESEMRLKSALRLAQQVESVKGRNALDELLKEALPNDAISPGYLHELLVKLNWRDIFTTNYDTLLEDAAIKVCKNYHVVTSKDSLLYKAHPRIVKVHGSFPDNHPFIITEEDYRTYPSKFPEFVNTVRQSLIETQFVLIGFSGDDPNFLNWLGWFRDIMGERMLPVYLIMASDNKPHESEFKLMEKRGIHIIPTSSFSNDIPESLDFILSYIGDIHTAKTKWTGNISIPRGSNDWSLSELTPLMKKVRLLYPGWMILPVDKIHQFIDTIEQFPFYGPMFDELADNKDKLEFLYELNWRLTISFFPKWIENTWYVQALEWADNLSDSEYAKYTKIFDELSISLLQIYRQRSDERFLALLDRVKSRIKPSSTNLDHRLTYEKAIWLLQHNDLEQCVTILNSWNVSLEEYRWIIRKARLFTEIGEKQQGIMLLSKSIDVVRRKLLINTESVFHRSALNVLENCLSVLDNNPTARREDVTNFPLIKEYVEFVMKEFNDEEPIGRTKTHGFNIGSGSTNWNSGRRGFFRKYVGASRYYQISEEYGFPLGNLYNTYNSDINSKFLPIIAKINIEVAINYLIECNDTKATQASFSRGLIMSIDSNDEVESLFKKLLYSLQTGIKDSTNDLLNPRLSNVVIPIASRISVLVGSTFAQELAELLLEYSFKTRENLREYLLTIYNALPKEIALQIYWNVLKKPVSLDYRENDYLCHKIRVKRWEGNQSVINNIIEALSSGEYRVVAIGIDRLQRIYHLIPEDSVTVLDNYIADNWSSICNTSLISLLAVSVDDTSVRLWNRSLLDSIAQRYEKFLETKPSTIHSSKEIENLEDNLILFCNCRKYLTSEQTTRIIGHLLSYISMNREQLVEDDSMSILGGMRRFWTDTMDMMNYFLSSIDILLIEPGLIADLLGCIDGLKSDFPFASTYVNIYINYEGGNRRKADQRLRKIISDGMLLKQRSFIRDAFEAVVKCDGKIGLQNVIEEVINQIHYKYDETTRAYLVNLPRWIENGVIDEKRMSKLIKFLIELPTALLEDENTSAEIKADLLYYGGYLVGVISSLGIQDNKFTDCVSVWRRILENPTMPADIRNGILLGQTFSEG